MPETNAGTVRMRDGKTHITERQFAENKETPGGYYLLECADLDQALTWPQEFHLQNMAVPGCARSRFLTSNTSRTRTCQPELLANAAKPLRLKQDILCNPAFHHPEEPGFLRLRRKKYRD